MLSNWGNVKTEKMAYISGILIILNPLKDTALYNETCYGLQCNIQKIFEDKNEGSIKSCAHGAIEGSF